MTLSRRFAERAIADGLVVAAILGWWLLSMGLPDFVMPSPWRVVETLAGLFLTPALLADTAASTARVVAAVALSTLIGGALAVVPYRWPIADAIVRDRIAPFLNSFPSVGWAILAMIWFGTTNAAVIFVEVAVLTPFCLINILEGLKELDTELLEMGSSFTRLGGRRFRKIVVPMLLPYLMAAIRIAYGIAWKIALVAELFGVSSGLGYLMLKAEIVSDAATVYATCFAIVLLFLAGEKLVLDPLSRLVAYK
ncbi:MAG TPA: ABC transporter permease subunit [Stellaceae bacterium]|nr:ABC transporter permease subunit [Stellaceae bacterium]